MKSTRKLSVILFACFAMAIPSFAQNAPQQKAQKIEKSYPSEKMIQELNLTPDQQTKLAAFQKEWKSEMQAEGAKMNATKGNDSIRQARRAQAAKRQAAHQAEIKKILTPEQYTKYLEMKMAQKGKPQQKGMRGGKMKMQGKGGCKTDSMMPNTMMKK